MEILKMNILEAKKELNKKGYYLVEDYADDKSVFKKAKEKIL